MKYFRRLGEWTEPIARQRGDKCPFGHYDSYSLLESQSKQKVGLKALFGDVQEKVYEEMIHSLNENFVNRDDGKNWYSDRIQYGGSAVGASATYRFPRLRIKDEFYV